MLKYQRYWLIFSVVITIIAVPLAFSWRLVALTFEATDFGEAAEIQRQRGALYGPGLINASYSYKLALTKLRKPEVLALGSSRAMQFRDNPFRASFANAGGAVSRLSHVEKFLKELFPQHKPKVLILALDYWWFNDAVGGDVHENPGSIITSDKLTHPLSKVWDGDLPIELFLNPEPRMKSENVMGIRALVGQGGYRPDGSLFQGNFFGGAYRSQEGETLANYYRIHLNESLNFNGFRTKNGSPVTPENVSSLLRIVKLAKENGVHLVVFNAPISLGVAKNLRRSPSDQRYIDDVHNLIEGLPIKEKLDFHDFSSYVTNDCEFFDGYHGGDLTYLRMLKALADVSEPLKASLNLPLIEEKIKRYHGRAFVPYNKQEESFHEADFLELGCVKSN